jgi:general secretion pathway protein L
VTGINHISSFLDWWGSELKAVCPAPLRRLLGLDRLRLIVRLDGHAVEAGLDRPGRYEPIAATEVTPDDWGNIGANFIRALQTIDPASVDTVLVVGSTQVVRRHLRLPPAAERDLAGLLSFEVERHTPFRPDEVYLAYRRQEGRDGDSLAVTVNVAPKRVIDPLIGSLTDIGFGPMQIVLGDDMDRALAVPAVSVPRRRRTVVPIAAAFALLLAAAVISPLLRLESVADDLTATAAEARRGLGANATAAGAGDLAAAARFLAERRRTEPSLLGVLNELADVLPDGTWLTFLSQNGRSLAIEGQTGSSADLVPRLESSRWFSDVTFDAPVTRQGGSAERFAFSLKIAEDLR